VALLERIAREAGMPAPALSPALIGQLAAHPMHGNVRELENLLHRAVALNDGDELHLDLEHGVAPAEAAPSAIEAEAPEAAPAMPTPAARALERSPPVPADLQAYLDQQERDILVRALQESGFNRTAAAARLGLSLRQIRYRIARLGIATPGGDDGHGGLHEL